MMRRASSDAPHSMLRWIFQKGHQLVTCRVDREVSAYTLALIPHTQLEAALVERFESGVRALQRHALMAARLRQLGWTLIAYTGSTRSQNRRRHPAVA